MFKKLTNKKWWKSAGERAIKTVAQTVVAAVPTTAVLLSDVNWGAVISMAALAGVLSVVTSVATVKCEEE